MRICINALLIKPGVTGGGETFLVNLVKRLISLDGENHYLILVTEENRHLFPDDKQNCELRTTIGSSGRKLARLLYENFGLPFYLRKNNVDLYYSPFGTLPPVLFCKSAVTIQNLIYLNWKQNVSHRGQSLRSRLAAYLQAFYYKLITPITLRRADAIWAVSKTTAAAIREHFNVDPAKIKVIYEGVDIGHFHPGRRREIAQRAFDFPYIVTVASLYPNKNIDKLISAFRIVVERGFKHKLVIIGPDWHDYREVLQAGVRRHGLDDRVIFTGAIAHADLPPYLWDADLFLLLSGVESFGLPVLEAMAAGVPTIVSHSSSLPEIAGDAALVTAPEKRSLLASRICEVLADRQISNRLRELGRNRARKFDWNATAAQAIDLFRQLDRDRSGVGPNKVGKHDNEILQGAGERKDQQPAVRS